MLLKLEVENFHSIRERQIVDLRVPLTTPDDPKRFIPVRAGSSTRVPRVVAFFGPNASGKTTVLKSIAFLLDFILDSFRGNEPGKGIPVQPFAAAPWSERPTEFVIEFAPGSYINPQEPIYRYELKIGRTRENSFVLWEALRHTTSGSKFRTLYERTGSEQASTVKPFEDLQIGANDPRLNVRNNVSVVSSLLQFDHPVARRVYMDFRIAMSNALYGRVETFRKAMTDYYQSYPESERPGALHALNDAIKRVDLGLEKVYLEERDGRAIPMFVHKGLDIHQPFENESQGTRNFYCLFPMLALALAGGGTSLIDEIDSDIHPMLLPEMVRWFRNERSNPHKAQLIMTCHAATLLEELVKEEVWFTEKDWSGATQVYGATHISNVHRRTNIYAKYLSGAFGALPQVG